MIWNAKLPLFVAGSMARIPGIRFLEADVVALSASIADLKHQVQFVQMSLTKSLSNGPAIGKKSPAVNKLETVAEILYLELHGTQLTVNLDSAGSMAASYSEDVSSDSASTSISKTKSHMDSQSKTSVASSGSSSMVDGSNCAKNNKAVNSRVDSTTEVNIREASSIPITTDTNNDTDGFKVVSEDCTYHFKIDCVLPTVSMDVVKDHMKRKISAVSVEVLKGRNGTPLSIHIKVPYNNKELVMRSAFWPNGVIVGGWRFVRNQRNFNAQGKSRNWEYDY